MNICIIGTDYVGLVTAACFAEMGNTVECVDVNPIIVDQLQKSNIHIYEPGLEEIVRRNIDAGRLSFTTDLASAMQEKNCFFVV